MITISLCMIVKDEEAVLARCLDSVKDWVDEIVVVDTGSCDRTRDIARQYTDRVYDFPWTDDFSAARNAAYSYAAMDYQMWLDADDVLPPEEGEKLGELKRTLSPDTDLVTMKYHTHLDALGAPLHTSTRERLTRRLAGFRWIDPVHECIPLAGKLFHSDIAVAHQKPPGREDSGRNLRIYEKLARESTALTPRQTYYFARELKDHGRFREAAERFRQFLDEGKGWREDNIAACHALGVCLRALGEKEAGRDALLESFRYDAPRAEVCCELGYHHQERGEYETALAWFRTAIALPPPEDLGFQLPACRGFIPNIEACVCCWRLGRGEDARRYNEQAGQFQPQHPSVLQNRLLLEPR